MTAPTPPPPHTHEVLTPSRTFHDDYWMLAAVTRSLPCSDPVNCRQTALEAEVERLKGRVHYLEGELEARLTALRMANEREALRAKAHELQAEKERIDAAVAREASVGRCEYQFPDGTYCLWIGPGHTRRHPFTPASAGASKSSEKKC